MRLCLLQYDNQQYQNNDQDDDRRQLLVVIGFPSHISQVLPRLVKPGLVPIHMLVNVIQYLHVLVQFVSDLYAEISLPPYAFTQSVQLLVLVPQYVFVIIVYLLVVERALIRRCFWVVAVGEQCCSVGVFLGQCSRLRVVRETD